LAACWWIQDTEVKASLLSRKPGAPNVPTLLDPQFHLAGHVAEDLVTGPFLIASSGSIFPRVSFLHAGIDLRKGCDRAHLARVSAATLPDDCRLIFHSHTADRFANAYYRDIVAAGAGKVLNSPRQNRSPYDELGSLMASADIGDRDYGQFAGSELSSYSPGALGELSHYLRCAFPSSAWR